MLSVPGELFGKLQIEGTVMPASFLNEWNGAAVEGYGGDFEVG